MNDKVTVPEAAKLLNISEGAVRQRIHRGSLKTEKGSDGRVYVTVTPEDTQNNDVNTAETEGGVTELLLELKERIRFLEQDLADRKEENRRKDHIIMALTNRIPELEAPSESTESFVSPAKEESRGAVPPDSQNRSWWRRIFAS